MSEYKYTAFVDTCQGSFELGTFSTPREAEDCILQWSYKAGLRLGVDFSSCVVETLAWYPGF